MGIIMRYTIIFTLSVLCVLCFPLFLSSAYADSCNDLDSNKAWVTNLKLMEQAIQYNDYDTAMSHAKILQGICDRSPVLNYVIAKIYHQRNDKEKELIYLQLAARNTNEFKLDVDFLDRVWTDKFIAVHPDSDPQRVEELKHELEATKRELEEMKNKHQTKSEFESFGSNDLSLYKGLLWTSVGVSVAGLVLTSVGGAYIAKYKSKSVVAKGEDQVAANGQYVAGWGMLGAGIATTLLGVTGMGIFGYKTTHTNDTGLSLIFSPDYAGIHVTF